MASTDDRPQYLSVDLGTSHVRAAVGGAWGEPAAVARRPIEYHQPEGAPDAALEMDPAAVWTAVRRTVRKAVRESGVGRAAIRGIGVTSQRLGMVLYDRDGTELYAGPNRDLRAIFQGGEIDADAGNMIWQTTGHGPGFLTAWAKLLWFKQEAPEIYERVRTVSGLADWLVFRMTGVLLMESALGVESGLALVATGAPADGLSGMLDLTEVDVPPTCPSGAVVGKLVSRTARELGLRTGVPVVAAGPDTQAGLVGLGVGNRGEAGAIAGWSAAVQRVTDSPVFDDTHAMWTGRHVVVDRWVLEGNAGEMGGAYDWLIALMFPDKDRAEALTALDRLASTEPRGSRGAAAYLGPSFVNLGAPGLRAGGLLFPVPLSFEPPDRGSLARAALESFAFAIRFNLDRLATFGGPVRGVAVGGGMVRTHTFGKILAAVVGHPIGVGASGESTALGALSQAAVAVGDVSMDEVLDHRQRELKIERPSPAETSEYGDLYHAWRDRERRLADIDL